MKYVYPAKIYAETGGGYTVAFPNVEGAIAQGEKLFDALTLAEHALCEVLVAYENFKAGRTEEMTNYISEPVENLNIAGTSLTLIKADTDAYRQNPSKDIELWYSPQTKKYFTMLGDDNAETKCTAEKLIRNISGVE